MKKLAITLVAGWTLFQVQAAELNWLTDLPSAQAKAKSENKIVLLDFTGSDWCGWCIKFKKEALDTAEFRDYAAKNLVLMELDFPNKKAQSEEVKKANQSLLGSWPDWVMISTMSPLRRLERSGTIRPFTLAPVQVCPTSE